MKSYVAFCLVFFHAFWATAECDVDFPDRCSIRLASGRQAPFTGTLLSDELAIALGQKANACDKRVSLEVAKTSSAASIRLQDARSRAAVDIDAAYKRGHLDGYQEGLEKGGPEWYAQPIFVSALTALTVVGLALAIKQTGVVQ